MEKSIDLRSDTVTKPSQEMRKAMGEAEVGDDVYGDDPTVNRLQQTIAERAGFEAALFAPSGTQANLIGIMSHCDRGDEYIVGQDAHTYKYEAGGAAVLGSIQPQPIEFEADSTLDLGKTAAKIKPEDPHFARTKLLCLENTQNGKTLPLAYLQEASEFCKNHKLLLHLDGARVFNAAVDLNEEIATVTKYFDSVSICLSKGLGAPLGSILCGSKDFIDRARKWRKMVGGGMRQAGIVAAAGLYALEHNVARLAEDHSNAKILAEGLTKIEGIQVERQSTNMVFCSVVPELSSDFTAHLKNHNILINPGPGLRLVTHLDVSEEDIHYVISTIATFFEENKG